MPKLLEIMHSKIIPKIEIFHETSKKFNTHSNRSKRVTKLIDGTVAHTYEV